MTGFDHIPNTCSSVHQNYSAARNNQLSSRFLELWANIVFRVRYITNILLGEWSHISLLVQTHQIKPSSEVIPSALGKETQYNPQKLHGIKFKVILEAAMTGVH